METIQFSNLLVNPGDTILDLGCGEGRHTIAANLYFPEAHCYAIDLNQKDLHAGLTKHKDFIPADSFNALYSQADAFALPFANNSFDHVVCSEVLEHIVDYQNVLVEIHRVLKPGGSFSASVPRAWPENICWRLSKAYYQVEGGHVRIFNAKTLLNDISALKFNFLHKHGAHALHAPYWWLRCLFWREGDMNNQVPLVRWYHNILVWDLMQKPWLTRTLELLCNPFLGKSLVFYFRKEVS